MHELQFCKYFIKLCDGSGQHTPTPTAEALARPPQASPAPSPAFAEPCLAGLTVSPTSMAASVAWSSPRQADPTPGNASAAATATPHQHQPASSALCPIPAVTSASQRQLLLAYRGCAWPHLPRGMYQAAQTSPIPKLPASPGNKSPPSRLSLAPKDS